METQQPGPKASARKSYGEYKAVIVHPGGRTEILGKRSRALVWVPGQAGMKPLPGGPTRFVRGKTFADRDAAVAFAQRTIDARAKGHAEYMAQYNARLAQQEPRT